MKYKVGDKVRVKTLEKLKKEFGVNSIGQIVTNPVVNDEMQWRCGDVVTINNVDVAEGLYLIAEDSWNWTDDMFDGLAEDFGVLNIEIGDRITYENEPPFVYSGNGVNFDKIIKVEKPTKYETTYEKPVLNKEEKEYLGVVIKPFKKDVNWIAKLNSVIIDNQYISVVVNGYTTQLPYFKKDTMYKGMKLGKRYSLKELGLE